MRCLSCDTLLTAYEATLRSAVTGDYPQLCLPCIKPIEKELQLIDRPDLLVGDNDLGISVGDEDVE